jgi:hypothetical protein
VSRSDFIVDEFNACELLFGIEKLLGVDLPAPAGASILSMVTVEEALPAAKRFLDRLNKAAAARSADDVSEGEI